MGQELMGHLLLEMQFSEHVMMTTHRWMQTKMLRAYRGVVKNAQDTLRPLPLLPFAYSSVEYQVCLGMYLLTAMHTCNSN